MTNGEPGTIRVSIPDAGLSVHAELFVRPEQNWASAHAVWSALPIVSTMGHVTGSGGGIWIPTTIVHLGPTHAAPRSVGSVYLNCAMQTLSFTYGDITESALVNEVGRVRADELPTLRAMGELVWRDTIASSRTCLVHVRVEPV